MKLLRVPIFLLTAALAQLAAAPVGAIKGFIRDSSGAVVPKATITLRNQGTDVLAKKTMMSFSISGVTECAAPG